LCRHFEGFGFLEVKEKKKSSRKKKMSAYEKKPLPHVNTHVPFVLFSIPRISSLNVVEFTNLPFFCFLILFSA
jgi:hypothetical protein